MGFDWWMAWLVGLVCVSVSLLAHFDLPNVRARPSMRGISLIRCCEIGILSSSIPTRDRDSNAHRWVEDAYPRQEDSCVFLMPVRLTESQENTWL
jgi:hypothetical protein